MLSPKGSSGTCIPEGQTTFPHAACTAHDILHPGHQVLHAAGQFGVGHVAHRVEDFQIADAQSEAATGRGLVHVPAVGAGEALLAGVLSGGWCRCWRCFRIGRRRRAHGGSRGRGTAGWDGAVEQGKCPAVQLDGQCMLAEFGPVRGVGAGAVRRQAIGLLLALDAGGAIGVEGHGVGQHQGEGFVQAVGQDFDLEFRAQLLAHLGDGVVPALVGRASPCRKRQRGGGWSPKSSVTRVVSGSRVAGVYVRLVITISPLGEGCRRACSAPFPGFHCKPSVGLCEDEDAGALLLGTRVCVNVLDVVCGSLGLRGRLHQQRGIMAQDRHPALEVRRAVGDRRVRHPTHAAEVGGAHFGHEFLLGVGRIAEQAQVGEGLPVEPRAMSAGMHELMVQGGVIRFRAVQARRDRQVQRIRRGRVERSLMPVQDRRAVRHSLDHLGTPLDGGATRRCRGELRDRHTVELRGIEDRVLPEHKAFHGLAGLGIWLALIHLPEHHRHAMLALTDRPPGGGNLVERRPQGGCSAHRREQPDIDAPVGPLAEEVAGQPQRAVPGLLPGYGALLQQGQDAVGDELVRCLDLCGRHRKNSMEGYDWCSWPVGSAWRPSGCGLGTIRAGLPRAVQELVRPPLERGRRRGGVLVAEQAVHDVGWATIPAGELGLECCDRGDGLCPRRFLDLFSMRLGSGYPLMRKRDIEKISWNRQARL